MPIWMRALLCCSRIIRELPAFLEEVLGDGGFYYQKGPGYPRVRINKYGNASVPLEELRKSSVARANLRALQGMLEEPKFYDLKREGRNENNSGANTREG